MRTGEDEAAFIRCGVDNANNSACYETKPGLVVPNYTWVYPFETEFDGMPVQRFIAKHVDKSFYLSAFYLAIVFWGRHQMASRPKYDLRGPLFIWNVLLALFSLHGAHRMLFELTYVLREYGFRHSVCNFAFAEHSHVLEFWLTFFLLSKLIEFGDTAFIVLRKQPLHFLHWYHHITVFLFTAYTGVHVDVTGRWFASVNFTVHTIMYSYYALKAIRIRVPRFVSMAITIAQLSQMIIGLYIIYSAHYYLSKGEPCHVSTKNMCAALIMYASYFLLFLNFFIHAYFKKAPTTGAGAASTAPSVKAKTM